MKAIQWLLNERGYPVAVDGIFGATTVDAVKAHQTAAGLPANGIVDDATWAKLVVRVSPAAPAPAVSAVQRELHAKRDLDLTDRRHLRRVDADGGPAFQKHEGMPITGIATRHWRRLIWHFELPTFNKTSLCDYSVGNGTANWATSAATNQLEAAARAVPGRDTAASPSGILAPARRRHRRPRDPRARPRRRHPADRKGKDQCRWGGNYRASTYDRAATRALVKAIRAAAPGHVKLIYFNDPVLIKEGLTTRFAGHDDHLHVRYCEKTHPLKDYDC